ncbi:MULTISPECIES: hypothetical protein [Brucella/Ochrobactrum group]|uniref:hypothetical protein n=1 Tax=Brucella/Ochrobactrum group TaxID=2826938 RepID=UPI001E524B25|nr:MULTISPECIES: hypothetical protein [Brucella/Ochrobactrum group]MCQ9144551.1 hypothetical protein [Ochrobactrum sp. BTU2]UGQ21415.1 hypothetical protein LRL11_01365 [Brucella anthropi]
MAYEQGMSIDYDVASHKLTIYFRGQKREFTAHFNSYAEAAAHGEKLCRQWGWKG